MTAINTYVVPEIRYTAGVKWCQKDLRVIDVRTRKLMTMLSAMRLYPIRGKGGGELHSVELAVREEEQSMQSYIEARSHVDPIMTESKSMTDSWCRGLA